MDDGWVYLFLKFTIDIFTDNNKNDIIFIVQLLITECGFYNKYYIKKN